LAEVSGQRKRKAANAERPTLNTERPMAESKESTEERAKTER